MRINEIFYSLQGEGRWTGTPAVFVRFAGCNLKCHFCDTKHEDYKTYTEEEIVREIASYPTKHVIFTGGEPTLQLTRSLVDKLHDIHRFVCIETNGSISLKDDLDCVIDWITVSPKAAPVKIQRMDEIKVVYQGAEQDMKPFDELGTTYIQCRYLQPCDVGNPERNAQIIAETIDYIKRNPTWKLSLQTQKILGVR